MSTITEKLARTPEDFQAYCNLNKKCPYYWNFDACVADQKKGECLKRKELTEALKLEC
ncbi:MAG: hypothetical protein WC325_10315 [Candidatus Bathyarchaeia archaeon]